MHNRIYPSFSREYNAINFGLVVSGVDEVGRGCFAGPVLSCIVLIDSNHTPIPGVNDSKQLSAAKRQSIVDIVQNSSLHYSSGLATSTEIDELGIMRATYLSMKRAYYGLKEIPDIVFIDGVKSTYPFGGGSIQMNHGDSIIYSIALASIIAKETRDSLMREYDKQYPEYDFINNVGYGTSKHRDALRKYGLTDIHRKSFIHI